MLIAVFLLPVAGIVAACDRSTTEPAEALRFAEILLVDSAGQVVYSHADHWHNFPVYVKTDGKADLDVHFIADPKPADQHDEPSRATWFSLGGHPEYRLRVTFEDPTLAAWEGDATRGRLTGRFPGSTRATFVVLRDGATQYQSPPLPIVVRP